MKKKNVKRYLLWALMAALVAGLAVMPLLAAREEEESGPKASILSAAAEVNNMEVSLKGGGTLSAGDAMDVKIPGGVRITDFLVSNGDAVREGDPVAKVDRVSVMNAIVEVKDSMEYLQDQINDSKDDTISSYIRAAAGGRVKQVFAEKGDSVMDVMLEHGALAVLSLDGRMAVEVEQKTALAAGDSILVTLADGKEITGRVESNLAGKLVVTLEDKGYAVGEQVQLATKEGESIGSGALYVHNAWAATGYSGTVQSVYAREESNTAEGNTLFVLTDTEYSGNVDHYSALHREYEKLLQELFQMYETEVLTAPCDGIVSGVDEESAFLLSAPDGEEGWFVDLLGAQEEQQTGWTVMLLSNTEDMCTGDEQCKVVGAHTIESCPKNICDNNVTCPANEHKLTCKTNCDAVQGCLAIKEAHQAECPEICKNSEKCQALHNTNHAETCPKKCSNTRDCQANRHEAECIGICLKDNSCKAGINNHTEDCPMYCDGTKTCEAVEHKDGCLGIVVKQYTGKVAVVYEVLKNYNAVRLAINNAEISTVTYTNKWDYGTLNVTEPRGAVQDKENLYFYTDGSFAVNDIVVIAYAEDGTYILSNTGNKGEVVTGIPNMGGLSGLGGLSGFGGFGGMVIGGGGSAASGEQELYDLEGDVLMTVTDHSVMKLSVSLDEQDITKIKIGQTAQVKVTALKNEVFEAELTDIGMEGTGNGGSSKFSVELTLPWQGDMLSGMNATAVIPLYTKTEVLTIPVAALEEEKGRTVVYTAKDPETGDPASPVEITTGISDGQKVEILTGLQRGDTVYYSYYDVLELDHTAKSSGMFG